MSQAMLQRVLAVLALDVVIVAPVSRAQEATVRVHGTIERVKRVMAPA
jgi:hypothetical protein